MSTSMVKGNPLKLMVQFALPLLLGNLLQQTYNIIDAAIVGQILGAKALASVGATSSVQFLVLGFCIGICAGFEYPWQNISAQRRRIPCGITYLTAQCLQQEQQLCLHLRA